MIKEARTGVYTRNAGNEEIQKEFNFYTDLNANNKIRFVRGVVDSIVESNYYDSIVLDMIIDFQIINVFTDVNIDGIADIELIEDFIEETNILDIVKPNIKEGLLEELVDSIKKNIEYRTGIHYSYLGETITKFVKEISKSLNGIDLTSLLDTINSLNNISEQN